MRFFKKKPKTLQECDSLGEMAKFLAENNIISVPKDNNHNTFGDPLDKLIDGDLPFGWEFHNRPFIEPLEKEYKYFLNMWVDSKTKSPKELYAALKSFVLYMEDVKRLCKAKGECYEFWCNEVLIGNGYLKQRKEELQKLSDTLEVDQRNYEQKQFLLADLDKTLMDILLNNPGILQKDVYKYFDQTIKSDVQELLYKWDKSGKINRVKQGNTYKIFTQ